MFDADAIRRATPWPQLMAALGAAYAGSFHEPARSVFDVVRDAKGSRELMVMQAWTDTASIGVKLLTLSDGSRLHGAEAIAGLYLLFDGETGLPAALFDAEELTARRTAGLAALATSRLAGADARTALIVGTGRLAGPMADAICSVRTIETLLIWGRDLGRAELAAAAIMRSFGRTAIVVDNLEAAVRRADIVSTLTPSRQPLVRGAWARPGAHVNLVGAYRPDMRESDGELLARAGEIYMDNRSAMAGEAGDIVQALAEGAIRDSQISGDMAMLLARDAQQGSRSTGISIFKSVGGARQDLAAALLCMGQDRKQLEGTA
jgi:ornithine cyclodeaminase/alanine dehydrogenase-like protein (mu-crystallin family)